MKFKNLGWFIVIDSEIHCLEYSKKEAENEVKILKWCDSLTGEKHHYKIIKEDML